MPLYEHVFLARQDISAQQVEAMQKDFAKAIEDGRLDPERLRRFRKLSAEESRNSEALHERRARERGFGRMVRSILKDKRDRGKP